MAEEIKLTQDEAPESRNFIHAFIEEDIGPGGQFEGMTVHTRFPPEPCATCGWMTRTPPRRTRNS